MAIYIKTSSLDYYDISESNLPSVYFRIETLQNPDLDGNQNFLLYVRAKWGEDPSKKRITRLDPSSIWNEPKQNLQFPENLLEYAILVPQQNKDLESLKKFFWNASGKRKRILFVLENFEAFKAEFEKYDFKKIKHETTTFTRGNVRERKIRKFEKENKTTVEIEAFKEAEEEFDSQELNGKGLYELCVGNDKKGKGSYSFSLNFNTLPIINDIPPAFVERKKLVDPYIELLKTVLDEEETVEEGIVQPEILEDSDLEDKGGEKELMATELVKESEIKNVVDKEDIHVRFTEKNPTLNPKLENEDEAPVEGHEAEIGIPDEDHGEKKEDKAPSSETAVTKNENLKGEVGSNTASENLRSTIFIILGVLIIVLVVMYILFIVRRKSGKKKNG